MRSDALLHSSPRVEEADRDLRCHNSDCDLYLLKLEPDEVDPEPGAAPDRCAECGSELAPYRGA